MTVLKRIMSSDVQSIILIIAIRPSPAPKSIIISINVGTHLSRVTSWEAPNMATPLSEARRGKGMDCKDEYDDQIGHDDDDGEGEMS